VSGLGPLFERDRELEVLDHLVAGAQHGEAALVLLEGPAGIGKTRLLSEARDQAQSAGFRVVTARGSEFEREVAYGVVRQLFESLVQDPGQRDRLLRGPAVGAVTRADFTHLKRELALTDGNLGRHLEVLGEAGFVKLTRESTRGRPRTWVAITPKGRKALRREVDALRKIMAQIEGARSEPHADVEVI
jgi:predicted ATPase